MEKQYSFQIILIVILGFFVAFIWGCKKEELATLTTLAASEITVSSAKSGGNISSDGGGEISSRGLVWATNESPSIEQHVGITTDGSGAGLFTSNITNLSPGTTYYVRAYAVNGAGTAYGNQVSFTTVNPPVANFTGTPTSGTAPLTVSFADQSANNPTSWSWNFGDGTTSTQQNPTKTYNSPGTYSVALTSSNSFGSNTNIKNNYITVEGGDSGDWPRDTETQVVDVTNPKTGKTWMDRNLGASRAATSSTDAEAYGDLYQWGRAADGHQKRTSGTTSTLSNSDTPGHGNFILAPSPPYDWRSPQNTNLWQGVNGINNPCPSGYRLPTEAEWNAELSSWSSNNSAGAFSSPLKLPVAGYRDDSLGSLSAVGSYGFYWSSTVDGVASRYLRFNSGNAYVSLNLRAYGLSLRCLKDN